MIKTTRLIVKREQCEVWQKINILLAQLSLNHTATLTQFEMGVSWPRLVSLDNFVHVTSYKAHDWPKHDK